MGGGAAIVVSCFWMRKQPTEVPGPPYPEGAKLLVSESRAPGPEGGGSLPATAHPYQSKELNEEIELVKNKHFNGIHAHAPGPGWQCRCELVAAAAIPRVCPSPGVSWDSCVPAHLQASSQSCLWALPVKVAFVTCLQGSAPTGSREDKGSSGPRGSGVKAVRRIVFTKSPRDAWMGEKMTGPCFSRWSTQGPPCPTSGPAWAVTGLLRLLPTSHPRRSPAPKLLPITPPLSRGRGTRK